MEVPWISVTQALPELGVKVLTACSYHSNVLVICGYHPKMMNIKVLSWNGAYWISEGVARVSYEQECVTHWLPIPEPPKG